MSRHPLPPTSLVVPHALEDVARGIEDQVRAKLARVQLVPSHRRTMLDALLGRNSTLLDEAEYFSQHTTRDRSATSAVRARSEFVLAIADLAETKNRIARANQLSNRTHEVAMRSLDHQEELYESALSDLKLRIARNEHEIRKLELHDRALDRDPSSGARQTSKERAFSEKIRAEHGIREQLAAVIAEIEAMSISDSEKADRIDSAKATATDLLQGAE